MQVFEANPFSCLSTLPDQFQSKLVLITTHGEFLEVLPADVVVCVLLQLFAWVEAYWDDEESRYLRLHLLVDQALEIYVWTWQVVQPQNLHCEVCKGTYQSIRTAHLYQQAPFELTQRVCRKLILSIILMIPLPPLISVKILLYLSYLNQSPKKLSLFTVQILWDSHFRRLLGNDISQQKVKLFFVE